MAVVSASCAVPARAEVPGLIHYQGRLVIDGGLYNGTTNLSFRLFSSETGGGAPLFEDSGTVAVVDGLYAAAIGDDPVGGDLQTALQSPEVWIELVVGSQVLSPRERAASSAYALLAAGLDGGLPDNSASNEVNTSITFDGTNLWVSDAAGTLGADISLLSDRESLAAASNALRAEIQGHAAEDLDLSTTNELNSSVSFDGTNLWVTDNGGALGTDLSALADREAVNAASNGLAGELLVHTAADADLDALNELNTSFLLTNDLLQLVDAGGTQSVDLAVFHDAPPVETDPVWTNDRGQGYIQRGIVTNTSGLHLPASTNLVFYNQGDNIIFGREALAYGTVEGGIAIGNLAVSRYRAGGVAIGNRTDGDYNGIAIGHQANGQYSNIAIGMFADCYSGYDRISIGYGVTNRYNNSIAVRGTLYLDGGTGVMVRSSFGSGSWQAKAFTIDHPLDPENKLLRHFCMEGPQVWNVYAGNSRLEGGRAEILLPDYYAALNLAGSEVFSLTAVGGPASLWVDEKPSGNRFRVGGTPDVEFSWTIKVLRNDPGCLESLRQTPVEEYKKP